MKITERYGTVLRCYDNGGRSGDRYTIIPPRWAHGYRNSRENGWAPGTDDWRCFDGLASSSKPFDPQGIGMHVSKIMPGKHLGKRVKWTDLPEDVQRFARDNFPEYAP